MQWFEDVLTLLEEGNMTRAATRRNITQPAFSRRIRSFEEWLGVKILERGANKVEISEALTSNEAEIRALMDRVRDLQTKIVRFDPASTTIQIAAQHALISSVYPDLANYARNGFPALKFRLFARNKNECATLFLRGDCNMLLSYDAEGIRPMPFDASVRCEFWGSDHLIPVVGGRLRYLVRGDGTLPADVPAIVYPDSSYFGHTLRLNKCPFGTLDFTQNPVCQTAFSNGIFEMVKKSHGVAWLPHSMCYQELERGSFVGLGNRYGLIELKILLYSDADNRIAKLLQDYLLEHRSTT